MRALIFSCCLLFSFLAYADTIENYMKIANSIPQMEMKADPQSQAWARSARDVLAVTDESIAETLLQANDLAKTQGKPLFCLPSGTVLNAAIISDLIQQTYKEIASQQSDKDKMTVSQIAWLGIGKKFPCESAKSQATAEMQHLDSVLSH